MSWFQIWCIMLYVQQRILLSTSTFLPNIVAESKSFWESHL